MKLYTFDPAPNPQRLKMFIDYKGIEIDTAQVNFQGRAADRCLQGGCPDRYRSGAGTRFRTRTEFSFCDHTISGGTAPGSSASGDVQRRARADSRLESPYLYRCVQGDSGPLPKYKSGFRGSRPPGNTGYRTNSSARRTWKKSITARADHHE